MVRLVRVVRFYKVLVNLKTFLKIILQKQNYEIFCLGESWVKICHTSSLTTHFNGNKGNLTVNQS